MSGPIFVVDTSPVCRLIVALALRRAGFRVCCYPDGLSALQELARSPEPPALLLLDPALRPLDGYHLIRLLRQQPRLASIPIVLMSARPSWRERLSARLVGASALLAKPLRLDQLVALVRRLTAASPGPVPSPQTPTAPIPPPTGAPLSVPVPRPLPGHSPGHLPTSPLEPAPCFVPFVPGSQTLLPALPLPGAREQQSQPQTASKEAAKR
ncbi:response regulator [Thermogemmatispora sp.]|uniref:response regulator n=1 Tax=Thermogemmatispora sp. TaxID=1968838 RepID=UPI0035E435D7